MFEQDQGAAVDAGDGNAGSETAAAATQSQARWRRRKRLAWVGVALGAVVAVIVWVRGAPMEQATQAGLEAARRRWEVNIAANYDVELRVEGPQAARYRVEVRDGRVTAELRNDQPLRRKRGSAWSIEGMFDTIAADIEQMQAVEAGAPGRSLWLRARFHPLTGLPLRYQRVEMVQRGANPEISWTITQFKRLSDDALDSDAATASPES